MVVPSQLSVIPRASLRFHLSNVPEAGGPSDPCSGNSNGSTGNSLNSIPATKMRRGMRSAWRPAGPALVYSAAGRSGTCTFRERGEWHFTCPHRHAGTRLSPANHSSSAGIGEPRVHRMKCLQRARTQSHARTKWHNEHASGSFLAYVPWHAAEMEVVKNYSDRHYYFPQGYYSR